MKHLSKLYFAPLAALHLFLLVPTLSMAHHSVIYYDGKTEVTISGVVKKARFGYPHSIYQIEVTSDDGSTELWTLSTEDPRDAKRLGFDEALKELKAGDPITVVGWPHQTKQREIRGHQLHYPDGRVVMMRRGNYIWPQDILRLDRFVMDGAKIGDYIDDVDPTLPFADQLVVWIAEDDHVARAAYEVRQDRPRLIGFMSDGATTFEGIDELLDCHTRREDFVVVVDLNAIDASQRTLIAAGSNYASEYNRVLSRWWEQERASCKSP
jgi:hypothetical protein